MNETTKYFAIGSTALLVVAYIFLMAETHGKAIESGLGMIGLIIIASCLVITGLLLKKTNKK